MRAKRGLLSAARGSDKRRTVVEHRAVDEFGEMAHRKHNAAMQALILGHQLGPWRRRKQDIYGRQDSYCRDCNQVATVAIDAPPNLTIYYGRALTEQCPIAKQSGQSGGPT